MLDHQHEQTHNIEHVEVYLPSQTIANGIEFIDLVSPYDDDGYDKAVEQQVPKADVILYACSCDTLPSKDEALRIDWKRKASHARLLFLCNRFYP